MSAKARFDHLTMRLLFSLLAGNATLMVFIGLLALSAVASIGMASACNSS
jgi:hypothetical protein